MRMKLDNKRNVPVLRLTPSRSSAVAAVIVYHRRHHHSLSASLATALAVSQTKVQSQGGSLR